MTISKKLLFIGAIAIGAQHSASAYSYDLTAYEYNAQYAYAANNLLEFAQYLRESNSIQAQKIADWLESEVAIPYYLTKNDIINMVSIANNSSLTLTSKIRVFSLKMNHSTPTTRVKGLCCVLALGGLTGLLLFAESTGKIDLLSLYNKYCKNKA